MWRSFFLLLAMGLLSCRPSADLSADPVQRLVDRFDAAGLSGTVATEAPVPASWRFDEPDSARTLGGWRTEGGVAGLSVVDGRLRGTTTDAQPLLVTDRTSGLDVDDRVHAVELRMRVSAGANLLVHFDGAEALDLDSTRGVMDVFPFAKSPLVPGDEPVTYTLTSPFPVPAAGTRHMLIVPTDAADAEFEIESIRIVLRREHLASFPSGVSWQGLGEIFHETLVARSPESIVVPVELGARSRLELAVGTPGEHPLTFVVELGDGDQATPLLRHTVTTADRWEPITVDLAGHGRGPAELRLRLEAESPGVVGLWGSPSVREVGTAPIRVADRGRRPQGVILIMVDTLRRDHLPSWGYERATAPALTALADGGVRFADAQSQATWTKVSAPSILTGLYPPTHGIAEFADRLPASAVTLAEVFRDAGYATLSFSSVLFTGRFSNLHQGFEELHEATSASDQLAAKTARVYVDRLLPWLDRHHDDPFFVFLHLFDPHDPYEPHPPYDSLWFDPAVRAEHERESEHVRPFIADGLMSAFLMPSRAELEAAGLDADRFVSRQVDWYDGSIRGFDVELARLIKGLDGLGLKEDTLVVFVSDHGEEFLDHGRSFHGQSVYGELTNVPLIVSWPGSIAPGVVETTVETVDLMPTIIELSGLEQPEGLQGRSLASWLSGPRENDPEPSPAYTQMAAISAGGGNPPPFGQASYSVVSDRWKLIHNALTDGSKPRFELYDHHADPLNHDDLAKENPEVVARLARELSTWLDEAQARRLVDDAVDETQMSSDELERLRSLGYIQ